MGQIFHIYLERRFYGISYTVFAPIVPSEKRGKNKERALEAILAREPTESTDQEQNGALFAVLISSNPFCSLGEGMAILWFVLAVIIGQIIAVAAIALLFAAKKADERQPALKSYPVPKEDGETLWTYSALTTVGGKTRKVN